ncbi:hypothetical protein WOLCODRAFT_139851 [Wolfiporia cocos MD-104 SS10]|uniref:Uncharacterized protein n=1 Tax=Wolfiporia cocos (strain MD-104) TaxID=742152 RepID=A0A2H3J6C2_WOLCO|nr:hypothetical protein WOLCODRAFT_139851 [Wolfiporia cocos MD-104 SS10]
MIFTASANATIETARHSMPQSTGSSTKAHTTPLHPPRTVYARVSPPHQADDTDSESEGKETKDVPEVPPPSAFTRQVRVLSLVSPFIPLWPYRVF